MSRNSENNVTLLDNDNDPGEDPPGPPPVQQNQIVNETQLELSHSPSIPVNPTASTLLRLIQREPRTLVNHIRFLEHRISQLLEFNRNIMSENARLKAQIEVMTETASDTTSNESHSVLHVSPNSGSSVHVLADVRSSGLIVDRMSFSSTTSMISPNLTVMYRRRGVEVAPIASSSCAPSTSHQVVVLQEPVFHDTELSDTSISERMDPVSSSENVDPALSVVDSSHCKRIVTYSLPHIVTFPSVSNIADQQVHDADTESGSEIHRSHSWPPYRFPYLGDFTMLLSKYLDENTDSEYEYEDTEHESDNYDDDADFEDAISEGTNSAAASAVSVPVTGASEPQIQENQAVPVTTINEESRGTLDVGRARGNEPYPLSDVVEHPFTEPLRGIHEENVLRTMFELNRPARNTTSGRLLYRRQGITLLPTREQGASSWAGALRAQIFLNVNLEPVSVRSEESEETDTDAESTDSIDSMLNETSESDIDIPADVDENDEGDGEQIDVFDEPDIDADGELEEIPPGVGVQADPENASSSDSGRGDAESLVSSSSTTSLSSHASETTGQTQTSTNFPYPSESNLGGKYGYLKAAIRRPRAPDGHRFVVSVFGTNGRRNNELNLPSWVPVYAERLECILNQFLDKTDSSQQIGPVMQVLHSSAKSQSNHSYRSVITCTASQEKRLERTEIRSSSRTGQLKSCLRVSREGSTGEAIPKNISWSKKIIVRSVVPLGALDPDTKPEIISSAPVKETIPSKAQKSQSCPDILLGCVKAEILGEGSRNKEILNPPEIKNPSEKKETKKKGIVARVFGKFWCNCTNGLRKSSSHECKVSSI